MVCCHSVLINSNISTRIINNSSTDYLIVQIRWKWHYILNFQLNCCGNENYTDYQGMLSPDYYNTVEYRRDGQPIPSIVLPVTCCSVIDGEMCIRVRTNGCRVSVARAVTQNSAVIGVLGVSVMFIQVSCIRNFLYLLKLLLAS